MAGRPLRRARIQAALNNPVWITPEGDARARLMEQEFDQAYDNPVCFPGRKCMKCKTRSVPVPPEQGSLTPINRFVCPTCVPSITEEDTHNAAVLDARNYVKFVRSEMGKGATLADLHDARGRLAKALKKLSEFIKAEAES